MSITVNLYYNGSNWSARAFAEEMERYISDSEGVPDKDRAFIRK